MKNSKFNKMNLFGVACAGEGFISSVSGTYMAVFLTDVALLPLGIASAVLMITSVFDFAMSIITGGIMSSVKPMKWGKLRSWLVICPPITALFFIIHFTSIPNAPIISAIIITLSYILAKGAWNFTYITNVSLIGVLQSSPLTNRSKLASQRMMGSNAGRLMGNYLTPIIVAAIAATGVKESNSYQLLMLIVGIIYLATCFVHVAITKGEEERAKSVATIKTDATIGLKDIFNALKTNSQLLVTVLIDLTSNVAGIALPSLAVYYYKVVAEMPQLVSVHMLCTGLAGLAGSTLDRILADKIKNYKRYLLFVYLIISVAILCTRFAHSNPYIFIGINIIIHGLTGTTQPFELNLYVENVVYTKWKTGVDANSLIMGLSNLPVKVAGILKSVMISVALISAGYVAGADPTPELKQAVLNAYSLPAIIPVFGFLLLKFAYKLTPQKVAEMEADIAKRENQ